MVEALTDRTEDDAVASTLLRFNHNPSLDGLRGLAVALVVLYHTHIIDGGWIGVEVFFVLSGYLISSLLMTELDRDGKIDLVSFWRRRARRLLPALFLLLGVIAVYVRLVSEPTSYGEVRRDVVGALTYSSNWLSIYGGAGYWEQFSAPSPLRHMWSLAVEEQFYLFYPLVAIVLLPASRRRVAVPIAAAVALAWQLWMVRHVPVDRFYLGTDTRSAGLLMGATIAVVPTAAFRRVGQVAAPVGLLVLVAAGMFLDGTERNTFLGPFQLVTLSAALVVLGLRPGSSTHLSAILSWRVLTTLGMWSYGVYLVHWPLAELFRQHYGWGPAAVTAAVVPLSLVIAAVSYRFIESPIRHRGFGAISRPSITYAVGASLAVVALVAATLGGRAPLTADAVAESDAPTVTEPSNGPLPTLVASPGVLARPADRPFRLMLVGDSVGASLADALTALAGPGGYELFSRAAPSCSYDRVRTSGGSTFTEDQSCVDIVDGWAADVASFRPDAVLFAYGSWSGWEYQGTYRTQCDPVLSSYVDELYELAVDDLSSTGARIYFVAPPYWRSDGTSPELDDAYDCLRTVMGDFVDDHPDETKLVDVYDLVCSDDDCEATAGGELVRPDGLHFGEPGATTIAVSVLSSMFEAPSPSWPETAPIDCC